MQLHRTNHLTDPAVPVRTHISRVEHDDGVLLYVSPLVGLGADGRPAGDDIASQVRQLYRNREAALATQGAGPEHIVRITGYARQGVDLSPLWALDPQPDDALATGALVVVDALDDPDLLYQEAVVAVVPQG